MADREHSSCSSLFQFPVPLLLTPLEQIPIGFTAGSVKLAAMKPYSHDLRERVIAALEAGLESQFDIAETFAVSLSTVEKWWRCRRETGRCAALPYAGGRPRTLHGREAFLRAEVKKQPDVTLEDLCARLAEAEGVRASETLGPMVDKLRFVDESGVHLGLTRLYGRTTPKKRVVEGTPGTCGPHYTVVADLGLDGVRAPWFLEGAMTGAAFETYVEHILAPTLKPGEIVLMDNLSVHKGAPVRTGD